jgi:hypothetical protein
MLTANKPTLALFIDRATHQWIVRDVDGNFWIVPAVENPWSHREPFQPVENTELEPVPGHYKYLLSLPF